MMFGTFHLEKASNGLEVDMTGVEKVDRLFLQYFNPVMNRVIQ